MGVGDIKRVLERIDLRAVSQALREQRGDVEGSEAASTRDTQAEKIGVPQKIGVPVCEVSLNDWKHFIAATQPPNQPLSLPSHAFEWHNGLLYAVELPDKLHDGLVAAIEAAIFAATGTGDTHLISPSRSFVLDTHGVPLQADAGFGPDAKVLGAGPPLPLKWEEYRTLKVEVGVDRRWSQLDRRAEQWRRIPGVHFILSVRVSRDLSTRQFRLDEVVDGEFKTPRMPVTDISHDATVHFDSRRLLGLAPHAFVPTGFSQPSLSIDMSKVVQQATEGYNAATQE